MMSLSIVNDREYFEEYFYKTASSSKKNYKCPTMAKKQLEVNIDGKSSFYTKMFATPLIRNFGCILATFSKLPSLSYQ